MNHREGYQGNILLKPTNVPVAFTQEQVQEYIKCAQDPIYFIKKYVKVIHVDRGLVDFDLYQYQEELVTKLDDNRFVICKFGRQTGKSVTVAAFFLHYIMFNANKVTCILANKLATAKEILDRIKRMFENLPSWLQQGVKEWNKTSIVLENDSKVIASATSLSAVRGMSINMLMIDEAAFIPPNQIEEFYTSVFPTISSGADTKVFLVSCVVGTTHVFTDKGIKTVESFVNKDKPENPILGYEIDEYKVHGRTKLNNGNIMVNSGIAKTLKFTTTSSELECSLNHKLWACKDGNYGWYKASELTEDDYISIKYGMETWGDNDDISDYDYTPSSKEHNAFIPPKKVTEDIAYFMGLFLAEGYARKMLSENGDVRGGQVVISCGDDLSETMNKLGLKWSLKDQDLHYCINSKSLLMFLEYLGIDINLKAKEKIIPDKILSWSRKNLSAFLRGYFDGDGCVERERKRISVVSASETMVKQIRMILLNMGILSSKYKTIIPPSKIVKVHSTVYSLVLNHKNSQLFKDNIGFSLDRKRKIMESNINYVNRYDKEDVVPNIRDIFESKNISYDKKELAKKTRNLNRDRCFDIISADDAKKIHNILDKNIKWEKIKKIENSENVVYDFSLDHIENDFWCHSVLYNGIIGHQTPNGMNFFYKMWEDAIEDRNDYCPMEVTWDKVPGRDEEWKQNQIRQLGQMKFDQEHEGHFLGSTNTLISGPVLRSLVPRAEKYSIDSLSVLEDPREDRTYCLVADVSRGAGIDFSAFLVIDITEVPYRIVARYRNNFIPPLVYPDVIYRTASKYNDAWILVEVNDAGGQVVDGLYNDYEYENLITVSNRGRKGQVADSGFGANVNLGIKTSPQVKRIGCQALKTLVEDQKIIVDEYDTIFELSTFIARGKTFEADIGSHDDLAMCLILWAWLTTQPIFKELTNDDIRELLYKERMQRIEDDMTPFGFIDDGRNEETFVDNEGTRWTTFDQDKIDSDWGTF